MPTPGFDPGSQRWQAYALTTALSRPMFNSVIDEVWVGRADAFQDGHLLIPGEKILKCFYHIWAWRPFLLCDQHYIDDFS